MVQAAYAGAMANRIPKPIAIDKCFMAALARSGPLLELKGAANEPSERGWIFNQNQGIRELTIDAR
jgi:hypothetical protein